ncbi:MAG: RusA family crossover junction endodeoxyribonuclease [Gemmatimonadaceae bacterium]|nr:RusA family crossover junction endodeoxyribonuclease [Gemmatimonadaceae bacterium]
MQRPAGHYGTGRNAGTVRPCAPEWPTTKPDADKLTRALLDALTGVAYVDDSQVVHLGIRKEWALTGPGTRVEVYS